MPEIRSEYSAQRIDAQPNPMLIKCIARMTELTPDCQSVVDLGCGKLRHLSCLRAQYRDIILVDTVQQLIRQHKLNGKTSTIPAFVEALRKRKGEKLAVMEYGEFAKTKSLGVHAVFCVAVFDVVLPATRRDLLEVSRRHLVQDGIFVLVIPRNDSSVLRRCTPENVLKDGHVFAHHGIHTFYHNFGDSAALADSMRRRGFRLVEDISSYRQVGLILRKR